VRASDNEAFSHRIGQQRAAQTYDIVDSQTSVEKVQALDGAGAQARDA
jgi:hypothetical protein